MRAFISWKKDNGKNSRHVLIYLLALSFLFLLLPSCTHVDEQPRDFTLLAINDVYRIDGVDLGTSGGLARVRSLRNELEREDPDLLLLHAGDFLFPSLLSRRYNGEQMIDILNLLDGNPQAMDPRMFVTFGNHEFDRNKLNDATFLEKRVEESQFAWLGSNIVFKNGPNGRPLIEGENCNAVPSSRLGAYKWESLVSPRI